MNLVDAILIVLLLVGVLGGIRRGAIKSLVELVGSVLILFLSWTLKGLLANVLIGSFPNLAKNPAISAVLYHVIAFVILLIAFSIIYKIILGLTDFVERVFDITVVFGVASKIIGGIIGLIESYVIMLFILFILSSFNIEIINESKINNFILEKTPLVAPMVKDSWKSIKDVYNNNNVEQSIQTLFENKLINEDNMNKLMDLYNETKDKIN